MSDKVYILKDTVNGYYKIGFTTSDPKKRLKACQTGNPNKLILLHSFAGGEELEKSLHNKFSSQRLEGEWFRLTEKQAKSLIEKYPSTCDDSGDRSDTVLAEEREQTGTLSRQYIPAQAHKEMAKEYLLRQRNAEFEADDESYKAKYPFLSSYISSSRTEYLLEIEKQDLERMLQTIAEKISVEIDNCGVEITGLDYTEMFFESYEDPKDIDLSNVEEKKYEQAITSSKKRWCKTPPSFRKTKLYNIQPELTLNFNLQRNINLTEAALTSLKKENMELKQRVAELESQSSDAVKEKLKDILASF